MDIREATETDLERLLVVVRAAFGRDDEAVLVRELLRDPTAAPRLSLIASNGGRAVGHILFTALTLEGPAPRYGAAILAPLAVIPAAQSTRIGTRLIATGLARFGQRGIELVFVLGDPAFYGRHGFEPASPRGFEAPYAIAPEHADAWMVRVPAGWRAGDVSVRVRPADALARPELWHE